MPFIHVTTNKAVSSDIQEKLKQGFGEKIELIPRKTEKWLMCQIEDKAALYFGGSSDDAAYVEVKLFGDPDRDSVDFFTTAATETVSNLLAIPPERIYVSYFTTRLWGFNGHNF